MGQGRSNNIGKATNPVKVKAWDGKTSESRETFANKSPSQLPQGPQNLRRTNPFLPIIPGHPQKTPSNPDDISSLSSREGEQEKALNDVLNGAIYAAKFALDELNEGMELDKKSAIANAADIEPPENVNLAEKLGVKS